LDEQKSQKSKDGGEKSRLDDHPGGEKVRNVKKEGFGGTNRHQLRVKTKKEWPRTGIETKLGGWNGWGGRGKRWVRS